MKISVTTNTQTLQSTFTKKESIPEIIYTQLSNMSLYQDYGEIVSFFHPSSKYFKECIIESFTDILSGGGVRTHYDIDSDDHRLEFITEILNKKTYKVTFQLFSKLNSIKKKILIHQNSIDITIS
jgi:hypothetical protein